jgi:integrative and conjugative element protein (TIGR02256 family)
VKMNLPNHNVVDILTPVVDEICTWSQDSEEKPESGGYIVGYQHIKTGNISLEAVSHPYCMDVKNRVRFDIRDPRHRLFLKKAERKRSYYMGVWHTHPQSVPIPSSIDWHDWHKTLLIDKTASQYVFFVIAGTQGIRVWVGDYRTGEITELSETEKNEDGIYVRNKKTQEESI